MLNVNNLQVQMDGVDSQLVFRGGFKVRRTPL